MADPEEGRADEQTDIRRVTRVSEDFQSALLRPDQSCIHS